MFRDLSAPKLEWDRPGGWGRSEASIMSAVTASRGPYEAAEGAHAIAVLTEWDE